jgi:hypothetical protein
MIRKGTNTPLNTRPIGVACALAVALTICAALVAPARVNASGAARAAAAPEATSATFTPTLSPSRPGAKGALTLAVTYTGGTMGVPAPVHHTVVSLPRGLTLEIPSLRSCSVARLQAHGPDSCPPQSLVGRGHALAEALAGSEVISEEVALWAFIGPPRGNTPTLELVGEGSTPVPAQLVVTGTILPARPPYGEQLVIPFPPIPSLPSITETALANLTLTIGASGPHPARGANTVVVPRCPTGGWPFAAAFTYADGSSDSTVARQPCPAKIERHSAGAGARRASAATATSTRAGVSQPRSAQTTRASTPQAKSAQTTRASTPQAKSAQTVSLSETGNLHLTSKRGFTLNEQGSATGTLSGTIHVRLTIVSSSRVKAEVNIARNGGSISGTATASYHRSNGSASFSGSLSVSGGTGSYAHAHGSGLSFGGTIQNSNDAIAVRLGGSISD